MRDEKAPTLNLIPKENIDQVVPLVAEHLASIEARSNGHFTVPKMLERFKSDTWQLWVVWSDAVIAIGATQLYIEDSGRKVAQVLFATGEHSLSWLHLMDDLKAWAKVEGCVKLEGTWRKGWARRFPDWKMTHVLLETSI